MSLGESPLSLKMGFQKNIPNQYDARSHIWQNICKHISNLTNFSTMQARHHTPCFEFIHELLAAISGFTNCDPACIAPLCMERCPLYGTSKPRNSDPNVALLGTLTCFLCNSSHEFRRRRCIASSGHTVDVGNSGQRCNFGYVWKSTFYPSLGIINE